MNRENEEGQATAGKVDRFVRLSEVDRLGEREQRDKAARDWTSSFVGNMPVNYPSTKSDVERCLIQAFLAGHQLNERITETSKQAEEHLIEAA